MTQVSNEHPFQCANCRIDDAGALEYREASAEAVGAYVCRQCTDWFPVQLGVADFSPPALRDLPAFYRFAETYGSELGISEESLAPEAEAAVGDGNASAQRAFFDSVAEEHDEEMLDSSTFWSACDSLVVDDWAAHTPSSSAVIDLGAGTGRCALRLAKRLGADSTLLAVDVSVEMLRKAAVNFAAAGQPGRAFLAAGDCAELAFVRPGRFDVGTAHGLLHHVREPLRVFEAWARVSKPASNLFVHDNNRTVFRPLFDALMSRKPLWDGGGHEWQPVLAKSDIQKWADECGMELNLQTHVFVPPHLAAALSHAASRRLIQRSDQLMQAVPGVRDQGGIVLFEAYRGRGALLDYASAGAAQRASLRDR